MRERITRFSAGNVAKDFDSAGDYSANLDEEEDSPLNNSYN